MEITVSRGLRGRLLVGQQDQPVKKKKKLEATSVEGGAVGSSCGSAGAVKLLKFKVACSHARQMADGPMGGWRRRPKVAVAVAADAGSAPEAYACCYGAGPSVRLE